MLAPQSSCSGISLPPPPLWAACRISPYGQMFTSLQLHTVVRELLSASAASRNESLVEALEGALLPPSTVLPLPIPTNVATLGKAFMEDGLLSAKAMRGAHAATDVRGEGMGVDVGSLQASKSRVLRVDPARGLALALLSFSHGNVAAMSGDAQAVLSARVHAQLATAMNALWTDADVPVSLPLYDYAALCMHWRSDSGDALEVQRWLAS